MHEFVVVTFPNAATGRDGSDAIRKLHAKGRVEIYAAVLVAREPNGKVSIQDVTKRGHRTTAAGAFIGGLAGIPFGPLAIAKDSLNITYERSCTMNVIAWIVLGLIAGFIGSKIVNNRGEGVLLDIVLGIVGAFLATWIGQAIGHYGPDQGAGFITATIGALIVLFIWNRLVARGAIPDWNK